jgi:catechol 2,3-dioxygenase-like lactoylglutathione lyase family enzyme
VKLSLDRMILFVHDVSALTDFYRDSLGLAVVETIDREWAVLRCGPCELALHRAGAPYRRAGRAPGGPNSNAKPVFRVHGDFVAMRERLISSGVPMGEIKPNGSTGPFCDGTDPEGNVFQIAQIT